MFSSCGGFVIFFPMDFVVLLHARSIDAASSFRSSERGLWSYESALSSVIRLWTCTCGGWWKYMV